MIRELLRLGVFLIAGVAVTGCGGGSGSSEGPDPTPANSPPTADAGADRTVDELTVVALSGSAQDRDGMIRTYQWTQISGPEVELENADTAEARFTAPDGPGGSAELAFRLTVTDDRGASASDEVAITVNFANNPPVVRGSTHFVVPPGRSVSAGILAEDPDGTVESYEWVQVLGPDIEFRWESSGGLHFSTPAELPDDGSDTIELAFLLTVTDDQGATATHRVTTTVVFYNSLPIANAGADRSVDEGDWVTLSGSANDSDGSIVSVRWTQLSGPPVELLDSHRLVAGFNAPEAPDGAANLAFRLTVMDNRGATAIDQVVISLLSNSPPSAHAGPDQTVEERARVTLSGSAEDPDGSIRSSRWTQVSGPSVELLDPDTLAAGFTAPEMSTGADILAFRLTVTDDKGAAASDEVSITVADEGAVKVSGDITFDYVPATMSEGLQYGATEARPVHGVTVELRGGADSRLIDAAVTGKNGDYALYALPDTTVFVRARAEILDDSGSWDVRVATDSGGGSVCGSDSEFPLYAMDSEPFDMPDSAVTRDLHAASGWTGDSYGEARVAAPFAILDVIFDAMQIVRATAGDVDFRPLHVFWGHGNTGASHTACRDRSIIRLSGAENENTDEYDRTLIAHEWSHYLHASFSRNDTLSGPHDPLFDHLEIATAFSEGLASALGAVVTGDAAYMNTFGPQQGVTEGFSVENTTHTGRGWFIEASIAQIVYDLIDPVNDDTVELGIGRILEVLTDDLRDTRSLTSIFSFIHALKNRVPDHAPAIDSILAYHRIQPIVDEWGSTETNTGGKAIPEVLPVYSELAVNGVPVNGCSVDSYGAIRTGRYNKLGIHRYFRFWADSEGEYSVTATLTSAPPGKRAWPFVRLRTAGRNAVGNSATCAPEDHGNCTVTAVFDEVPAGDNVLVLWDGGNSQTSDSNRGKMCFDVEVTRQ